MNNNAASASSGGRRNLVSMPVKVIIELVQNLPRQSAMNLQKTCRAFRWVGEECLRIYADDALLYASQNSDIGVARAASPTAPPSTSLKACKLLASTEFIGFLLANGARVENGLLHHVLFRMVKHHYMTSNRFMFISNYAVATKRNEIVDKTLAIGRAFLEGGADPNDAVDRKGEPALFESLIHIANTAGNLDNGDDTQNSDHKNPILDPFIRRQLKSATAAQAFIDTIPATSIHDALFQTVNTMRDLARDLGSRPEKQKECNKCPLVRWRLLRRGADPNHRAGLDGDEQQQNSSSSTFDEADLLFTSPISDSDNLLDMLRAFGGKRSQQLRATWTRLLEMPDGSNLDVNGEIPQTRHGTEGGSAWQGLG
ncbi:hypothetical protein B0H63DRAFT_533527 [Podospora didyma]|uniref:F-box domain-containing protein n=1 Tax=Podospora didyma TaxID=330526 RepID=A0AAE0U8T6_9PEZI|nr:hypothetical protein B0H63DRAFT_533527 [Podospora didyma]